MSLPVKQQPFAKADYLKMLDEKLGGQGISTKSTIADRLKKAVQNQRKRLTG